MSVPPQSVRAPARVFQEADLRATGTRVLKKGSWGKADILIVTNDTGMAIVKDFNAKVLPVRWWGRWQIRREASIYRRLAGLRGVPRYFGRIGKNAMAIEYIEGERISHWRRRELPEFLFVRLWALIEAIHARGIVHIDLRKRDNILVTEDGRPCIIDFNASFCFDPAGLGARFLFPLLRRIDDSALLKWKEALAPAQLSQAERDAFRRMSFLRKFWIFK